MTKRDFFILIVKLFGLFSLVRSLFYFVPNGFSLVIMDFSYTDFVWLIIVISLVVAVFVLLIFKSDKVVNILSLDKNFDDERIEIGNINPTSLIHLAIIIIAGFLIIDNIPSFLIHSYYAFKMSVVNIPYKTLDKFLWAVNGINIVLGFILLTNYHKVSTLLRVPKIKNNETI